MKQVPGYILLCMTFSSPLLAQQDYYHPGHGPAQINWPEPVADSYADPNYGYYADSTAAPVYAPPAGGYGYDRYYGYQPQYNYYPYPQPEYVVPPGPDWPGAAYDRQSLIPPDLLLREGYVLPSHGYQLPPQNLELAPGAPVEVIPPPNIPLTEAPAEEQVTKNRASFFRSEPKEEDKPENTGSLHSGYSLNQARSESPAIARQPAPNPNPEETVEVIPPPNLSVSESDVINTTKPVSGWRPPEEEAQEEAQEEGTGDGEDKAVPVPPPEGD